MNLKKVLSILLVAVMLLSVMPFTAFAAPPGSSDTGTGTGGISIGGGSTVVGEEPYLTFTGTDSFSIKTNNNMKNWDGTLEYSTDTNTWTTWDGTQISSDNNVLYLRGTGNTQITGSSGNSKRWVITTQGTVACSGDIRTLLDYNNPEGSSMGNSCFSYLFRNCTSLTAAPALPATVLTYDCYYHMFDGCRSLTTAPELPATTLAQECYSYMFYGCKSLTTAPALPATTLISNCYSYMFAGCTSLTTAPALSATTLARHCYYYMFEGCTSLTTAPELPATTLVEYCYQNMFNGCENLTTAPELPAKELESYCYDNMFYGCTSLTTAPELWATSLAPSCYSDMFNGCRSLTTAPQLPATTLASYCYYDMFNGCTSLTTAPELPATTLTYGCYRSMFQGCTSLTTPSELPATTLTSSCYNGMFRGCTGIKLSTEQTAEYSVPYSIPKQGTAESVGNYALTDMFTGTGGTFTGTPTINTTYYIPGSAPTEPNNGTNITVADTISENFYLDDEFYGADAYIALNYNHNSNVSATADFETDVVAMSSLPELSNGSAYDGNRIVSVIQAPAQATEDITITVYRSEADALAGENAIDTINYNVYDYCKTILDGDYGADLKELAETTLDYAAAAQIYFNYNTDNMATKDNAGNAFYNEVAAADLSGVTGIVKPACVKSATMVAKSDLEINLLSLDPISVNDYSMEGNSGKDRFTVSDKVNGDYYEINIKGIVPANMNKTITVNTTEGEIVLSANSIMKVVARSSNANLANLAKAMYLYGAAAYSYFGA